MKERWVDILGYEGLYKISNKGRVKSLKRNIILKSNKDSSGYLVLDLCKSGIPKKLAVHKLVAKTFLNHTPNGKMNLVIDHIDGNKLNNCVTNLREVSQRENLSNLRVKKTSNYVGVSYKKERKKWLAIIYYDKRNHYIGLYNTQEEARDAYLSRLNSLKTAKKLIGVK